MQVIIRVDCPAHGPLLLAPPSVGACNKERYWGLVHNAVLDTLQPIVKPAQLDGMKFHFGIRSIIQAAYSLMNTIMNPWADNQTMFVPEFLRSVMYHAEIIVN